MEANNRTHRGPSSYIYISPSPLEPPVSCSDLANNLFSNPLFITGKQLLDGLAVDGRVDVEEKDTAVENMKARLERTKNPGLLTYGTLGCGYETMTEAWGKMSHVFSIGAGYSSDAAHTFPQKRGPGDILSLHPVDVFVVDQGHWRHRPAIHQDVTHVWGTLVDRAIDPPAVIVESWHGGASTWENGPSSKLASTQWKERGYRTRCKLVKASRVGGAVTQTRLLVIREQMANPRQWRWGEQDADVNARPMSNLLTPPGLIRSNKYHTHPPQTVGGVSDPLTDPMPCGMGIGTPPWLRTDRGYRQLELEELGKALGIPTERIASEGKNWYTRLAETTSLFHWEYISQSISPKDEPSLASPSLFKEGIDARLRKLIQVQSADLPVSPPPVTVTWVPPDLRLGSRWYLHRVRTLFKAVLRIGREVMEMINEGLDDLAVHRGNYDRTGAAPTELRVLWWEFPHEHWDALRKGSSMNFLKPPDSVIHKNGTMDPEQQRVAGEFIDELVALQVIGPPPAGMKILATTPLFAVPKAGQPNQWRMIADMLRGGQNQASANDPVYLNRPLHILEQMYENGWSAVVDASKFFYQFRTRREDWPYLGLVHPVTGELLCWKALPMGAANSPACAGRYGLAFIRLVRERLAENLGKPRTNTWWTSLTETGYDPELGYGYVLQTADGQPAVRIWAHVDDFLIHGPTQEATLQALHLFLDTSVDVGLLCHPKKLVPPTQTPLYTGFIFDTRGIPTLRVPTEKREKALAMTEYLLTGPNQKERSRLALAVITGTLESLAEATPARVGHTYLRRMYDLIHPPDAELGAARYYTTVALTQEVKEDLGWWVSILQADLSRMARSYRSGVLIPTFGDGSGTGTGGTILLPEDRLRSWMGQWSPYIFKSTSNWKELKTLLLTLQLMVRDREAVWGSTLFYFTDNSVTYYIAASGSSSSPGLHALIEQIRHYEMLLECRLQVIHVPGVVMIQQGTDGLSRGIWGSDLHPGVDQRELTASLFEPAREDLSLVVEYAKDLGLPTTGWVLSHWETPLLGRELMHTLSAHFPPPELARQTIIFFLEAWVESPMDTGALFFVPRVVPAFWHGLSRHVREVGKIAADQLLPPPHLPIPVIILAVLPYTSCLSLKTRYQGLDGHGDPSFPRGYYHKWAADEVRGLQGIPLRASY